MKRRTALFMIAAGASSYGLVSPAVKYAYSLGFGVTQVMGAQFVIAALVLWILAGSGWLSGRTPTAGDWLGIVCIGTLGTGLSGLCYFFALHDLPASLAVVLLFQFTWMAVLIESLWEKRRPPVRDWVALALVLAGTCLAVGEFPRGWHGIIRLGGIVWGLLSAVSYAGALFLTGRVAVSVSPFTRSAGMVTAAAVILTAVRFREMETIFLEPHPLLLLWGAYIALLAIVIPQLLFSVAIPEVGGGTAALVGSVELPVAILASAVLLGEPVSWIQWLGIAGIIAGILVADREM